MTYSLGSTPMRSFELLDGRTVNPDGPLGSRLIEAEAARIAEGLDAMALYFAMTDIPDEPFAEECGEDAALRGR